MGKSEGDGQHHIGAYNRMMERVRHAFENDAVQGLQRGIDSAKHKAVELGELTREDAEQIGQWLRRDLSDAGYYLASTSSDLGKWLRFDIEQVEARLLELFQSAADRTRLEYLEFENSVAEASEYRTGQVTSPGTLRCDHCGKELHFLTTGHIPPCPGCHHTTYGRVAEDESG